MPTDSVSWVPTAGVPEHFGVMDEIDLYFGAFAKSMAGIGGFVAGPKEIINYLRYNLRPRFCQEPAHGYGGRPPETSGYDSYHAPAAGKLWSITKALQEGPQQRF